MIALDTNVVVRLLTNDDPAQARKAVRVVGGNDVRLSKTVLLESEWVLRRAYRLDCEVIRRSFEKLLGLPNLSVEDEPAVASALDTYSEGIDFADALHVASSSGAEAFVTFDRKLANAARRAELLPVVRVP